MKKLLLASLLAFGAATSAHAVSYGFSCITGNSVADCTTGEAQLSMDVTAVGGDKVSFLFTNTGPNASSITDVYFDFGAGPDRLLTPIFSITNGAGVDFSVGAHPGNLPGGNTIGFSATATGTTADSNPPAQPNGVNPGEQLEIIFQIALGFGFQDVLDELDGLAPVSTDPTDALRVGIHVQGFAGGGSESFVNTGGGDPTVPEPGTLALLGAALAGLGALRRRPV